MKIAVIFLGLWLVLDDTRYRCPTAWERWQCEQYLPRRDVAVLMYVASAYHMEYVRNLPLNERPLNWKTYLADAEYRSWAWWYLQYATNPNEPWVNRQWGLYSFIGHIGGPENYLRGHWPNPVPRWQP